MSAGSARRSEARPLKYRATLRVSKRTTVSYGVARQIVQVRAHGSPVFSATHAATPESHVSVPNGPGDRGSPPAAVNRPSAQPWYSSHAAPTLITLSGAHRR